MIHWPNSAGTNVAYYVLVGRQVLMGPTLYWWGTNGFQMMVTRVYSLWTRLPLILCREVSPPSLEADDDVGGDEPKHLETINDIN